MLVGIHIIGVLWVPGSVTAATRCGRDGAFEFDERLKSSGVCKSSMIWRDDRIRCFAC
jgi:hypothetical protein